MQHELCLKNHTQQSSQGLEVEAAVPQKQQHQDEMAAKAEGRRLKQNYYNRESYRRRHPNWRKRRTDRSPITREFILSNVLKDPETGCWNWTRATCKGYGRVWDGNRFIQVHRASFELWAGPIPEGLFACHKCDNRKCCNPDHIFCGNQFDNMRDAANKGRVALSARKLTDEQVLEIRSSNKMATDIAREYAVSISNVCKIRSRITYKNLP